MNLKTTIERINKTNHQFKKANKARRRIMVAKDIINAIDAKEITSKRGYLNATNKDGTYNAETKFNNIMTQNRDNSLKDVLPLLPQCDVCAKGAILVCAVLRQNEVTCKEVSDSRFTGYELNRHLKGLFSASQLNLIELHFEGWDRLFNSNRYRDRYPDRLERMKVIMQNVVRNQGTFIPNTTD